MAKRKSAVRVRDEDRYSINDEEIITRHFANLIRLLKEEEAAEEKRFQTDILDRKPEDREKGGKALLWLELYSQHYTPAGQKLLSFGYSGGRWLPRYSLDVGDVVALSAPGLAREDRCRGTVYEKNRKEIVAAFQARLPAWVGRENTYHLNKEENKTTYERMQEAVRDAGHARHGQVARLRNISLGLKKPDFGDPVDAKRLSFFDTRLNDSQKKAVISAMEAKDVFLIHGPPGTGKTSVLLEMIRQARHAGQSVLVSAPSNAACDHLVNSLIEAGEPVTRFGNPARITERLRKHTFSYKLVENSLARQIEKNETEIERLFKQNDRRRERGANSWDDEKALREQIHALRDDNRALKSEIFHQVWKESDVVVATHTVSGDPLITSRTFDWVILDEAGQATEPASWIPMRRAGKVIMAGDHCQLPPTVISPKTGRESLCYTLFERFHDVLQASFKIRLEVQYRMHETIMGFSSREFYEKKLTAHAQNRGHLLADLKGVQAGEETKTPFVFLDTAGLGFEEKEEEGTSSRFNEEEARLVARLYADLVKAGVRPSQIGIISPYKAQVKCLHQLILGNISEDVEGQEIPEIDSVDAFQGREKEAILVALVRSNLKGDIGFLSDTRRMNVALTRAKRQLIVVGDSATISILPFYKDFIRYAETVQAYRSA